MDNPHSTPNPISSVIRARRSIRAYLPTPVPKELLERVLQDAARAPSGSNIQPWKVHVLQGATLDQLTERVCQAFDAADTQTHTPEYDYYPSSFAEPYQARRRKVGWDLYGLLGISKGDVQKMQAQHRKNFTFFGAPVGLVFTIDRTLNLGSWLDYGMFLQNVMLAAQAYGLSTCPQAAWIAYHRIFSDVLNLPPEEQLVCGIALGYGDPDAIENSLVSERADLHEFVTWHV